MKSSGVKILAIMATATLIGYVTYRIYKYQRLLSGNRIKDERKIKIITN